MAEPLWELKRIGVEGTADVHLRKEIERLEREFVDLRGEPTHPPSTPSASASSG
jgi:hypothetical protein